MPITFERASARRSTSPTVSTRRFFGLVPSSFLVSLPMYVALVSPVQYVSSPLTGSRQSLPMMPLLCG
jgi:hypothetical protein